MICTRKEFEELCGIEPAYYTMNRKRGKIIEDVDEHGRVFIDTDRPENKHFMSKRVPQAISPRQQAAPVAPVQQQPTVAPKQPSKLQARAKDPDETVHDKANTTMGKKFTLELQKLEVEIKQKEVATALNEQKLATIVGNNIPSPIVTEMFAQLAKSLLTGYRSYIEQEINNFCHKHKINDKDRVAIQSKVITGLNQAHTKSVNDARANMKAELKRYKIKDSLTDEQSDD